MYFNEINILDYYSVEWKSSCVGVYQLLNWKMHGETLKVIFSFTAIKIGKIIVFVMNIYIH